MGDVSPPPTGSSGDQPSQGPDPGTIQENPPTESTPAYTDDQTTPSAQAENASHLQQMYGGQPSVFASQMDMAQVQMMPPRMAPYNMGAMANALPQPSYRPHQLALNQQQRYPPAVTSPGMAAPMQLPQYGGQPMMNALANQQYYLAQQSQMAQYYAPPLSPPHHPQQQSPSPPRPNMGMYASQVVMHPQQPPPQSPPYYYPQQYLQQNQAMANRLMLGQYMASGSPAVDPRPAQPSAMYDASTGMPPVSAEPGTGRSNVVRGPPRKPRQSGHAIWIGNLPPQTELMSLVHHVCMEAPGLESLFLISKSNCAFANYKDEQTCAAAQQKLHDSKFQSVRLVSRLRKSAVESASGISAPTGPAASAPRGSVSSDAVQAASAAGDSDKETPAAAPTGTAEAQQTHGETTPQKDRFFILKSLTVEDLELSVRTGIWATQSHNENTLNKAFQEVENVYLIFSANKSGEYFGYARMISPINEDPAAAIEFAPKAQSTSDLDLPKAIPTEATEFAPRGRIIDDSARGTIFWEAEHADEPVTAGSTSGDAGGALDDAASAPGTSSADESSSAQSGGNDSTSGEQSKAWGKPFKLEWLSVTRLPFYRTRGLRNAWNSNREVKIARDGTELEPSVGRKLIGLFNRVQSPAPQGQMVGMHQGGPPGGNGGMGGPRGPMPGAMGMMPGYPAGMRPPFSR